MVLDKDHSPAGYSKFLSKLLDRYYTLSRRAEPSTASELSIVPQYHIEREQSPRLRYSWPDTPSDLCAPEAATFAAQTINSATDSASHVARQEIGDLDMDFSLQHFVQSTLADA